jgi:hypothetical protein
VAPLENQAVTIKVAAFFVVFWLVLGGLCKPTSKPRVKPEFAAKRQNTKKEAIKRVLSKITSIGFSTIRAMMDICDWRYIYLHLHLHRINSPY